MATVVRLGESGSSNKAWVNTHPTNVFADQVADRDEWDTWFEGLGDSTSLTKGGLFMAVDASGSTSVPFKVQEVKGDGKYIVDFKVDVSWRENRADGLPAIGSRRFDGSMYMQDDTPSIYDATLVIGSEGKKGTKLRAIGGQLRVPDDFKFLKLESAPTPRSYYDDIMPCCGDEGQGKTDPIELGKIEDVQLFFQEKTARLKIFNNSTDVHITSPIGNQRLSKKAAFLSLIGEHGFRENVAREMLRASEQKGHAIYRAVYAPSYGVSKTAAPHTSVLAGGPSAPMDYSYSDERSSEQYGNSSVETQYGGEDHQNIPEMSSQHTDPSAWDNWNNYESGDMKQNIQLAQQAGANGQKEVMDVSMISGMLKNVREDSLVERYLGTLVESLDALGRLLFNFYWHQEDFEDRYGKSDMPELEDSIRNSFESLGDLIIFLKEKTIESPTDQSEFDLSDTGDN